MKAVWTLTSLEVPDVAFGLFDTREQASEYLERHPLAINGLAPIPIVHINETSRNDEENL
jgi:hypothetical protein